MIKLFQLDVLIILKGCLSFNLCMFCSRAIHITDYTSIHAQSQISKTVNVLVPINTHNHRKGCGRCQLHLDGFKTPTETEFSVHFNSHFRSGVLLVAYNTKAGMPTLEGFTSLLIFITQIISYEENWEKLQGRPHPDITELQQEISLL